MPPPQGFSQASFSSRTMVRRPARASRSAAVAPAGPPPSTATVFIAVVPCFLQQVKPRSQFDSAQGDPAEVDHLLLSHVRACHTLGTPPRSSEAIWHNVRPA